MKILVLHLSSYYRYIYRFIYRFLGEFQRFLFFEFFVHFFDLLMYVYSIIKNLLHNIYKKVL